MTWLALIIIELLFLGQILAQDDYVLERSGQRTGNNSTLVDVHVRFHNDLLQKETKSNDIAIKKPATSTVQNVTTELEVILWETVGKNDWKTALYLLNEFAGSTQNITLKYIAYNVLWRKLKVEKLLYDPEHIIHLYTTMRNAKTIGEECNTNEYNALELEIRTYLIERCAQLLEMPLHPANYNYNTNDICNNDVNYPVVRQVLKQLNQLDEDIFEQVLNVVFDAVELLENKNNVTVSLNCLGLDANQRLTAHLIFLQRNIDLKEQLFDNVQKLLNSCDMSKLPSKYLKQISVFLPESLRTLHNTSSVCIRNTTGNLGYLSECAQTTLMCTYSSGYEYRSVFHVERLLGNKFTFHSTFWNRYIRLETNFTNGNNTVPAFIKNVIGSVTPSVWQAVFVGNNIALVDTSMRRYLCGGNPAMWTKSEQYAYTRRVEDFQLYQNECLWFIEDCSYMI